MSSYEESGEFEKCLLISTVVILITSILYHFLKIWYKFLIYDVKCEFGIPVLGTHWREIFNIETWHSTIERLYYKYPDERFIVLQEIGGRPAYLIRDPDLVKQIAVRDFSSFVDRISGFHPSTDPVQGHKLTNSTTNDWRRIRNLLTPLLSGQKLKQIVIPSLNENKRELMKFLNSELEKNDQNEIVVDMMDLSTRSVVDGFCLIAFGVKTDSLRSKSNEYGFIESTQSFLNYRNSLSKAAYWSIIHFPRTMKYLFGKTLMPVRDNDFFTQSCRNIANDRITSKIDRADYIQLLQSLRDQSKPDDNDAKDYSEIEVVSQCFDFYQSVITENNIITTYLSRQLAINSEVQERLYDEFVEIKTRIGDADLTYDVLNAMKYAEMVISEGLRLYPIVTELKRRATKPYILENNNGAKVAVNPGDAVWLPAYTLQNDPQYYPNPSEFDAERFNDENRKNHASGTYAPFGLGPRDCIGCKHPMYELKILFYHILLNFKIVHAEEKDGYNKFSVKLQRRW